MTSLQNSYKNLSARLGQLEALEQVLLFLEYDRHALMPSNAGAHRTAQRLAVLQAQIAWLDDPDMADWLAQTSDQDAQTRVQSMRTIADNRLNALQNHAPTGTDAYAQLKARFAMMSALGEISGTITKVNEIGASIDSEDAQIRQSMALAAVRNFLIADPNLSAWLDEAEQDAANMPVEDRRNLTLMRERWLADAGLPAQMVEDIARVGSEGEIRHTKNYKGNDWSTMKDWYAHSFDVAKRTGLFLKDKLGVPSSYDALLHTYSPGLRADHIEREFATLKAALIPMIRAAVAKQAAEDANGQAPIPLSGPFPAAQQEELCRRIVTAMGFDLTRGRIDAIAGHPSCSGGGDDVRLTTRFEEDDFLNGLYSAIHEAGHGLYEQNTPAAWRYQPAGSSYGMAVHETESMIFERNACKSPEFFRFLEREARTVFSRPNDPALDADNLRKLLYRAQPSFIRVDADELTYPLHVILRFELEKAIIDGKMDVADLPKAWNDAMKNLLGIEPPGPSQGCMQDVHWPCGLQGYFPAYALGAMGAAQLFAAACRAHPDIPKGMENGDFTKLRTWLRDNIHSKGSLLEMDDLFIQATGEKLNARHFLDYLSRSFLGKPYMPPAQQPHATRPPPSAPGM